MEVDEEIDAGLLRQFNCMGTTDKDVLVKELQKLIGVHISEQTARFYLDMADWNLQAAICAYFDLQSPNKLPRMTFVKDITIGEGESVPPNTRFTKTWQIYNSGDECWPSGCQLTFTGGDRLGAPGCVTVAPLPAGESAELSIEMISPENVGLYSSKWRMSTAHGNFFGDTIWVILQVETGGTMALMQQMSNFRELGSPVLGADQLSIIYSSSNPFLPPNEDGNSSESGQVNIDNDINMS